MARVVMTLAVVLASTACSVGESEGSTTVTVAHGVVTRTATVPGGPDGIGTLRTFHADLTADGGVTGYVDATMITISVDTSAGTEAGITAIVIALNDGADQSILEGSAIHPAAGSTVRAATTIVRPVIGGSGAHAGALGWAGSTRLADDTWTHVFHLEPRSRGVAAPAAPGDIVSSGSKADTTPLGGEEREKVAAAGSTAFVTALGPFRAMAGDMAAPGTRAWSARGVVRDSTGPWLPAS